jgi:hypothetical protein
MRRLLEKALEESRGRRQNGAERESGMARIPGQPEDVRRTVEALVQEEVPDAVCELRDYAHRIACGTMDQSGNIQDFVLVRDQWEEEIVRHYAKRLAIMVRTGGSTAG